MAKPGPPNMRLAIVLIIVTTLSCGIVTADEDISVLGDLVGGSVDSMESWGVPDQVAVSGRLFKCQMPGDLIEDGAAIKVTYRQYCDYQSNPGTKLLVKNFCLV